MLQTSEIRHYEPGSEGGGRTWATIATLLQTAFCRARQKHVYTDQQTMPINRLCQRFRHHSSRLVGIA
ncbi:hypothetical protein CO670_22285 [Rhizobium sp. J15]|uniref:Uncharacterized protein n=3 Tax=Rhizobium TaxID=379 RepID=A0A2A6J6N5_9HYPH|nr:hypothetical protein CPT34_33065 [Rhizobium sophoriradicis]PDS28791.1 hypothetical protein CO650_24110 [Rhizobium phaseoli]PDT01523.1 hypothetical protein CO666_24800 [Rhizobium chutanense]PDT07215.1 hypothetical protein CO655_28210 [Rhizobium sp. M1]PDT14519.1 hypothetical protein CO670_22285 [Rhizobium sp. J15]PDT29461.1 hypothetical protein CO671_32575 [Rhizobium sp. M10]RUM19835.1 hypothetical protein EFQ99_30855 [Rhizobium vallis]RVU05570.1 hypothetical protein EOS93_30095 [Rhizobium